MSSSVVIELVALLRFYFDFRPPLILVIAKGHGERKVFKMAAITYILEIHACSNPRLTNQKCNYMLGT